jgi:hypothetical protein
MFRNTTLETTLLTRPSEDLFRADEGIIEANLDVDLPDVDLLDAAVRRVLLGWLAVSRQRPTAELLTGNAPGPVTAPATARGSLSGDIRLPVGRGLRGIVNVSPQPSLALSVRIWPW